MLSAETFVKLLLLIFFIPFICFFIIWAFLVFQNMKFLKYLRKNRKDVINKISSFKIKEVPALETFKKLPWANKDQNEIISPIKGIKYIYNNQDMNDKEIRYFKQKMRNTIKLLLIDVLVIAVFIILGAIFLNILPNS